MKVRIESSKTMIIHDVTSIKELKKKIEAIKKILDVRVERIQFKGIVQDKKDKETCFMDTCYNDILYLDNSYFISNVDGRNLALQIGNAPIKVLLYFIPVSQ